MRDSGRSPHGRFKSVDPRPARLFRENTTKGAFRFQSEAPSTGNSRHFGADDLPERPLPFMWQAWKAWRVEHPPDG